MLLYISKIIILLDNKLITIWKYNRNFKLILIIYYCAELICLNYLVVFRIIIIIVKYVWNYCFW